MRLGTLLLCTLALALGGAAPALADEARTTRATPVADLPPPSPTSPNIFEVTDLDRPPPHFAISARQAIRIAERTKAVREARAKYRDLRVKAFISPLRLSQGQFYHWAIEYSAHGAPAAEVEIGRTGVVFEVSSDIEVGWPVIRGYSGVLGHKLNAPYVWLPLCLLFVAPFFDFRRPFRLLHLDLVALLSFGASHYFFNLGRPDTSVPLVYPVLAYVAARALVAAFRPTRRAGPLVPHMSTRALALMLALLLAARAVFCIYDSGTFDISFAGVIGADRIEHGLELYVDNDYHPDTYGPMNYLAYVPFELLFPYDSSTEELPAGKAASLGFDLLTVLCLFLLGNRLRAGPAGRRLGLALALGWTAYPYTSLVLGSTTNDALIPLFVVLALLAIESPARRAASLALGTMTKFAPALLAPVFAVGRGPLRFKDVLVFSGVFAVVCAAVLIPFLPDGGVREVWNTTLGFQLERTSPLSLWDRHPSLEWLQTLSKAAALALAGAAAFVPRRRSTGQVAALCAAILALSQVATSYWIYFYAVWLAPLLLIAVFAEHRDLGGRSGERDELLREPREPLASFAGDGHEVLDPHAEPLR